MTPARPLRVVRLIDRLNVGGPAKHVVWLTAGLDRRRFATTLVTGRITHGETDMGYFAEREAVTPVVLPEMSRELSLRDALVVAKVVRLLFRLKPDVVHTHKAKAGAIGRLAALVYRWLTPSALRLRPRPCQVVHTYHGHVFHSYYGTAKTAVFLAIERALGRFATDRIVAISEQQRRELVETYRIAPAAKFAVVPLGLDLAEIGGTPGRLRAELGVGTDVVLLGIVGRLTEVKNHALLLRAVARLVDGAPSRRARARVVVVGDGHLRAALEALAADLGIADVVTFLGFRPDAAVLYADLDAVVLTSLNEGTPLTLIEGMACGRPVIATLVGGVVDLMGARRSGGDARVLVWDHGLTVPSGDAAALAHALARLIGDPTARRDMGERARRFAHATFGKERLLASIDALYSAGGDGQPGYVPVQGWHERDAPREHADIGQNPREIG